MARLSKAVKLTGAQVDALLTLNDEALREALYRLRAQTKAPSVEETAAEIVSLLTAPTADEQILAAMASSLQTTELAVEALNSTELAAGVQADDGEA
jgi:hypothetical protein